MSPSPTSTSELILFELVALRLGLYGLADVDRSAIRRLARSRYWLETRFLLREHGATEAEISELMRTHQPGCPCWYCVLRLNRRARAHHAKLTSNGR